MHGLINRAVQCFVRDSYGAEKWEEITNLAGLDFSNFEPMLHYDDAITRRILVLIAREVGAPLEEVLENIGTYLVSHPNVESLRRLLRFGGVDFTEFLHSLDDLPDRARLAVEDLELPKMELHEKTPTHFTLYCTYQHMGFGYVVMGVLRTLADDYGALALLEYKGQTDHVEVIEIQVVAADFAEGRSFDLAGGA